MRDVAVEFVLHQFIEIEQREEAGGVGDQETGDEMVVREAADEPDQQRVEREERGLGARVPVGRDADVMLGVPAAPHREQRILRRGEVDACALTHDHRRQLGDDDDRNARDDERDEHVAHGEVEARRDDQLEDAKHRSRQCDGPALGADAAGRGEDHPQAARATPTTARPNATPRRTRCRCAARSNARMRPTGRPRAAARRSMPAPSLLRGATRGADHGSGMHTR